MNGHVDEHDTKEEEVYQDLCSIQWASRPQVCVIFDEKKKKKLNPHPTVFYFNFAFQVSIQV